MSTEHQHRTDLARRIADRLSLPLERVEHMLAESEQLREICDEYDMCRTAVERWRSAEVTGHGRLEEYEALSDELETEIVRLLAGHQEDSP